jgi:hypothetical protein
MPVILSETSDIYAWLDVSSGEWNEKLASLLRPYKEDLEW